MAFKDLYVDPFDEPILVPGPVIDAAGNLFEPHVVRFDDAVAVLGATSRRALALGHL